MFYKQGDIYHNLDQIVKVQDLERYLKYDYYYRKEPYVVKSWFGLVKKEYPAGYYLNDWFANKQVPCTEEQASYGDSIISVWYSNSGYKEEMKFANKEEKLKFLALLPTQVEVVK
jgi:hypothetical protein